MGSRGLIAFAMLVVLASTAVGQTLSRDLDSATIARPGVLDRTIRIAFDRTRSRIDSVRSELWSKTGDTLMQSGTALIQNLNGVSLDSASVVLGVSYSDANYGISVSLSSDSPANVTNLLSFIISEVTASGFSVLALANDSGSFRWTTSGN